MFSGGDPGWVTLWPGHPNQVQNVGSIGRNRWRIAATTGRPYASQHRAEIGTSRTGSYHEGRCDEASFREGSWRPLSPPHSSQGPAEAVPHLRRQRLAHRARPQREPTHRCPQAELTAASWLRT